MLELTPLKILGIVWGAVTLLLVIIYMRRGILQQHEEDALFLDKAQDHIRKEQEALVTRITAMDKIIMWLGIASGVLLLAWAILWVYIGFTSS